LGKIYIALLHHPVMNRSGEVVTSSVTSLDLHDLARAARTYGIAGTFVVHPFPAQRRFVSQVVGHFVSGPGRGLHPERGETLEQQIAVVSDLDVAISAVEADEGRRPLLVGTSAQPGRNGQPGREMTSYSGLRKRLREAPEPGIILFGTSWGLAPEVMDRIDIRLPPVLGDAETEYNHLSVRAAAAVILDRLLGDR
jgi:hypothetical protein